MTQCMNELGLIQLDREDSITAQQMVFCCTAILGKMFNTSRPYYCVLHCVQYENWTQYDGHPV